MLVSDLGGLMIMWVLVMMLLRIRCEVLMAVAFNCIGCLCVMFLLIMNIILCLLCCMTVFVGISMLCGVVLGADGGVDLLRKVMCMFTLGRTCGLPLLTLTCMCIAVPAWLVAGTAVTMCVGTP